MHACMQIYIYMYIYICISIYIYIDIHISMHMYIYICLYVPAFPCNPPTPQAMWVFPKIWENHPKSSHLFNRVWNHYFHHPFWGVNTPYFLGKHPYMYWQRLWIHTMLLVQHLHLHLLHLHLHHLDHLHHLHRVWIQVHQLGYLERPNDGRFGSKGNDLPTHVPNSGMGCFEFFLFLSCFQDCGNFFQVW